MATTNLSLDEHREAFINSEVSCGRYGSASEVVRDALRSHLAEGETQALRGEFVQDYSVAAILASSERDA
jgi:antitoxin ParD1/3/4